MELTKKKLEELFNSITASPKNLPFGVLAFCTYCSGGRVFLKGHCEQCGQAYDPKQI